METEGPIEYEGLLLSWWWWAYFTGVDCLDARTARERWLGGKHWEREEYHD